MCEPWKWATWSYMICTFTQLSMYSKMCALHSMLFLYTTVRMSKDKTVACAITYKVLFLARGCDPLCCPMCMFTCIAFPLPQGNSFLWLMSFNHFSHLVYKSKEDHWHFELGCRKKNSIQVFQKHKIIEIQNTASMQHSYSRYCQIQERIAT